MFTPQEVFNKVIEWQLYPATKEIIDSSNYMCVAIKRAYQAGLISKEPCVKTVEAINQYIGNSDTLFIFLEEHNLPSDEQACLNVYKDWKNRPILENAGLSR